MAKFMVKMDETRLPEVSYKEVSGNPFLIKVNPLMLTDEGFRLTRDVTLLDAPKGEERRPMVVSYGRDYVLAKLLNDCLIPLAFQEFNDFQKLMSDAWKAYKALRISEDNA
jgi:hypothetical protein